MLTKSIPYLLVAASCLSLTSSTSAQTFLEKLKKQINENLPSNDSPAEGQSEPPSTRSEPLPAPIDSAAAPPTRTALGIRVSPITESSARAHQLAVTRGALITGIEKGSPADAAKLPLGAAIVAIDGRRIDTPEQLVSAVRSTRPGRDVEVTYYERNRLARKTIRLNGQAVDVDATADQPAPARPSAPIPLEPNTAPNPPLPSFGQQLGGSGSRPLLGRIGRVLDNVIAPAQATEPVPLDEPAINEATPIDSSAEITALRQQVAQLQKQVELLQKTVESLERKMAARD